MIPVIFQITHTAVLASSFADRTGVERRDVSTRCTARVHSFLHDAALVASGHKVSIKPAQTYLSYQHQRAVFNLLDKC